MLTRTVRASHDPRVRYCRLRNIPGRAHVLPSDQSRPVVNRLAQPFVFQNHEVLECRIVYAIDRACINLAHTMRPHRAAQSGTGMCVAEISPRSGQKSRETTRGGGIRQRSNIGDSRNRSARSARHDGVMFVPTFNHDQKVPQSLERHGANPQGSPQLFRTRAARRVAILGKLTASSITFSESPSWLNARARPYSGSK